MEMQTGDVEAVAQDGADARLAAQLETIITARLTTDRLVLPALPAAAVKCLKVLRDPQISLKAAAAVIEDDPVLAVQLVRLSNRAALATREPVRTVLGAVTKLGTVKLRAFLFEASAIQLVESRDPRISKSCRAVWQHSLAVAMLAKNVATFVALPDPDAAYLGGLLHDIGKPVVASLLLQAEKTLIEQRPRAGWIGSDAWSGVIARIHRRVGVALAERWDLPEEVITCLRSCDDYDVADRLSVVNVVRFANALAKRAGIYLGRVDHEDNNALIMIGTSLLGLDASTIERSTTGLQTQLDARVG
jgi:putative nucleotidyltransferase with HDIG domain